FLETVPLHSVAMHAFLISRDEITVGEWIAFLDTLPPQRRELLRPQGRKDGQGGFVDVRKSKDGQWRMQFRATETTFEAGEDEPLRYEARAQRTAQNWLRFPVSGISPEHAVEFTKWLNRSGRVPGARLCSEREWERAARGADAREFPHGNRLLHDDANF